MKKKYWFSIFNLRSMLPMMFISLKPNNSKKRNINIETDLEIPELKIDNYMVHILNEYLKSDLIPYALLIDGEWGCGKTWFFKEKFESIFNYKMIYISANGIQSVEEISQQILYQKLYITTKLIQDPKVKIAWSIAKQLGKSIIEKYTGYNASDLGNLKEEINELITIKKNEVLVIDDIERMNENLKIEDFLGYINSNFTEHNKYKVLLVCDEKQLVSKLRKGEKKRYHSIKEKVIWHTIQYDFDFKSMFVSVCNNFKTPFKTFLLNHQELLKESFETFKVVNIRWIIFYFNLLEKLVKQDNNFFDSEDRKLIIFSILVLCIEYKSGKLNSRIDEPIPNFILINSPVKDIMDGLLDIVDEPTTNNVNKISEEERFSNTYLAGQGKKYHFFENLYKFVCFGLFDFNKILNEIELYESNIKKREEWHILLDDLVNLKNMEDEEFEKKWNFLIDYIRSSKFLINDIRTICGLYTLYTKYGIKFPIPKSEFFNILTVQLEKIDRIDDFREDQFSSLQDQLIDDIIYKELYNKSERVLLHLHQKQINENLIMIIEKIKNNSLLSDVEIGILFERSNIDQINEIGFHISQSVRNFTKFETSFSSQAMDRLRALGFSGSKQISKNLELFISQLIRINKSKNILYYKSKHLKGQIQSKILKIIDERKYT